MLQFKTKLSSIVLDDTIKIKRKGKSPLQEEYSKVSLEYVNAQESSLSFVIGIYKGAYIINIKVKLTDEMKKEIFDWFSYNKPTNNVTIKVDKITIKEI